MALCFKAPSWAFVVPYTCSGVFENRSKQKSIFKSMANVLRSCHIIDQQTIPTVFFCLFDLCYFQKGQLYILLGK